MPKTTKKASAPKETDAFLLPVDIRVHYNIVFEFCIHYDTVEQGNNICLNHANYKLLGDSGDPEDHEHSALPGRKEAAKDPRVDRRYEKTGQGYRGCYLQIAAVFARLLFDGESGNCVFESNEYYSDKHYEFRSGNRKVSVARQIFAVCVG